MVAGILKTEFEPVVLLEHGGHYAERLRRMGVEVLILGGEAGLRAPKPVAVPFLTSLKRNRGLAELNRLIRLDLARARFIGDILAAGDFDVVHHNAAPRADRASIFAAHRARIPQVSHVRQFEKYVRPLDPWIARLPHHFLYVSKAIEDHCRRKLGMGTNGTVVYSTVDVDKFASASSRREEMRQNLGIAPGARVIAGIGRIVRWKGQDVLLRALSPVLQERADVVVLLVGGAGGDADSRRFEAELTMMVRQLGLEGRVRFTGFMDDVPGVLAASDLVVHSAIRPEPFGRVIAEAMAAGRPVIATRGGGAAEIIRHGGNGLLTPMGSVERLTEAIGSILNDPARARTMTQRASEDVGERFGVPRLVRTVTAIYRGILVRSAGAP
jgi:glycosyltransferase involved in cell wall biosynthesis